MNILLTNHRIHTLGGSEQWVKTMYKSLEKLGHNVSVKTYNNDEIPLSYQKEDGRVYDLALINHLSPRDVSANFRIYTSHGIIPTEEIPKRGANSYVAVSEESKNYHKVSSIIRNPIDLSFYFERSISQTPQVILVISNNPPDKRKIIREAFPDKELIFIGGENRHSDVNSLIEKSDVVITLGRGVYEAMGMNRNVLVFDYKGGEGMIDENTYYDYRTHNCSGRKYHHHWSAEELRAIVLTGYKPEVNFRPLIKEFHDPEKIAKEYLQLYYNAVSLTHG